jgi:hypothetical protein
MDPKARRPINNLPNEETAVPQIWLTYDELATLIGCDPPAARATASAIPLDRRKSHDGHTRTKLNAQLTEIFLDRLAQHWIDREVAASAGDLHMVRERMAIRPVARERTPAAPADRYIGH